MTDDSKSVSFDVTDTPTMIEAMSHSLGSMLDPGLVMTAFHASMNGCDNDAKRAADKVRDNLLPIFTMMAEGKLPFDIACAKGVVSSLVAWDLLVHCVSVTPRDPAARERN